MASRSTTVIDLTLEPDSPELRPRTTGNSRRGQQPSGQPVQVIDLTEDADDDDDDTPTISGSRTLPGRPSGAGRGWLNSHAASPFGNGRAGNAAMDQHARPHTLMGFAGLNAFTASGFEGFTRLTNFALDSIPSLGRSGSATASAGGSRSGSDSNHSGRPQGIGSRRRPGRQPGSAMARHIAGRGGSAGVRGSDVFFGAAGMGNLLNPLGSNQPDLNYENNGYLHQQLHLNLHQRHFPDQQAAQLAAHAQMHHDRHHHHHHRHVHHLDVGGGIGGFDPDKPPYVAPPDPPAGFSRSTGQDMVAVCVSCDEELAYDSNQGGGDSKDGGHSTSKRKQSRKEREEHPFWAVTGCGHVYCRRCFDNRRNALRRDKLPAVDFKTDGKAIFCAAENCRTDVTAKKAWVGLFV